jgi:hypothetical protein
MLKEDLERFNEWWFTGKIRKELALPFKRHAFRNLVESLAERQILIIVGLRRVGKTTLLYQTIEKLLETARPESILYFSFDEVRADPKQILEIYEKQILNKPFEECGKIYVFFDEIQYCKNWASVIKQFYDLYPNMKFFLSGSSSLLLTKEALERLAGRFFLLELKPLTFLEFLEMKGVKTKELNLFSRRIEAYFFDYLKKAGFPEIVDFENEEKISEYVKNSVIDRVILRDLPIIFKTKDIELLERIVKLIFSNPGAILNINSLSKDLGKNKITVSNYLKFLESALLIRVLSNFRPSFLASSRKLRKYYPTTTSLIFSVSKDFFRKNIGKVLETYVVNSINAKYYFRKLGKEIDIILVKEDKILPVEVKESIKEEADIENFSKLITYVKSKKGVIISLNQKIERKNIKVLPAYLIEKGELLLAHDMHG